MEISTNKYHFQNLDLKNIKGEIWKDIPGLEFYFKISNYGRIKRLSYEQVYNDGRVYQRPERIIKPIIVELNNSFVEDKIYFVRNRVILNKQVYDFSIARLLYHYFIASINLDDQSIIILTKDGNGLNLKLSNLKIASLHEKQKRIYEKKRNLPYTFDEEARQRGIIKSRLAHNKQITQYDLNGKKIETFASITMAAQSTGISHCHISQRARGLQYSAGGFIWRLGNEKEFDISEIQNKKAERKERNKRDFGKKITQYKMTGKRIAVYPTINDAAKVVGISNGDISKVIRKLRASAGGFYWLEGIGEIKIDLSNHEYGLKLRINNRVKTVKKNRMIKNMQKEDLNFANPPKGVKPLTMTQVDSIKHKARK
jgi:hypothetical protein